MANAGPGSPRYLQESEIELGEGKKNVPVSGCNGLKRCPQTDPKCGG